MQQIAILNYEIGRIDVYTIDESIDAEDFIVNELKLDIDDVCYMSRPGVMPITIHCDD